jgi:hypothetical protein
MTINYEDIIRDGIAEGKALLAATARKKPPYDEEQKQKIKELRACAKDVLAGLKVMKGLPSSRVTFEEEFLVCVPKGKIIVSAILFTTNILRANEGSASDCDAHRVAISITKYGMALCKNSLLKTGAGQGVIESMSATTPLARKIAATNILRRLAVMAVQNKKL